MTRDLTKLGVNYFDGADDATLFFNPRIFFRHMLMYTTIDVLTYTLGTMPLMLNRVVFSVECENVKSQCKTLRQHKNLHTKMFLCYRGKIHTATFVGSLNCRLGINYNIMLRVPKIYNKRCRIYFDQIWDEAKPL